MVQTSQIMMLPLHRYIDSNWGSEYTWAINIARSVATQGISFTAVIGEADRTARALIESTGNNVVELGVGRERDFKSDIMFYSKLCYTGVKLAFKTRPYVIHHVFPLGYKVGYNPLILCSIDIPSVIGPLTLPSLDTEGEPQLLRYLGVWKKSSELPAYPRRILSLLYRQTLLKASYVLFDSETTRSVILRLEPRLKKTQYGILPTGGVDTMVGHVRRKRPIDRGTPLTLGTLSYLRPKKHVDTLIRAISLSKGSPIRLLVAGDGPMLSELAKLASDEGVQERVSFIGRVSQKRVPEYLSRIDILCSLDKIPHETMPSVQEAMMCGASIIASKAEPLAQAEEVPYGFLVDAHSPEQVSYAIERFIGDPDLVSIKGAAARDFATTNFSLESVGKKLKEVYETCMKLT